MRHPQKPTLVVVTGPPAAGKTAIAAAVADRLGWPLVAKDALKETLADALGVEGRDESRRLGAATFDVQFHVLGELLGRGVSAVAEGNFARLAPFAALPPAHVLQVHVTAPAEVLRARMLAGRRRHRVHYDVEAADDVATRTRADEWEPLELGGELVRVDTERFPDIDALADRVAATALRLS